jgi:nucleoside phosphorylase
MTLLVAATAPELCGRKGLVCGVGPVEAALATARALAEARPAFVLHVGIAGAAVDSGLRPPALVVGERSLYEDAASSGLVPATVDPSLRLVERVLEAESGAVLRPIGTAARLGAATRCPVEAMEGFGVLRACAAAGVPAVELRAISNLVGEPTSAWRIEDALEALRGALGRVLPALDGLR